MKTKETWIGETMNSLVGIERAGADPGLFLKVQAKLNQPVTRMVMFRRQVPWALAAGVAILIALNIFGILVYHQSRDSSGQIPAAIVTDYLSYLGPIKF
jgi:hypothetical protein